MNPKLHFSTDDLEAAFEEIRSGETIHSVADALGIPTPRLQALYNDAHPTTIEETTPVAKQKTRTVVTDSQRAQIVKLMDAGGVRSEVAEKFGVSKSTIDNIRHRAKLNQTVEKTRGVLPPVPDVVTDLSVTVETDFIVVRIPRKHILAAVLRDLI